MIQNANIEKRRFIYNDTNVSGYVYSSNKVINKVVIVIHGMAEHIERYDEFMNTLALNGFICYGYNHQGHYETSPDSDYGYMSDKNNMDKLINDLDNIYKLVKEENPNSEIYLFSHSMGSFVSQRYIELHNNFKKVVVCGSGMQSKAKLKSGNLLASLITFFFGRRYKSKLLNYLSFGSYNKMIKNPRCENDWLNQIEQEVDKYQNDKYCGGIFSCSFFKDFTQMMIDVQNNYHKIDKDTKILLIAGAMDPVGDYSKGVKKIYETLKANDVKDVTIKLYENNRHELLLDKAKSLATADILEFYLK